MAEEAGNSLECLAEAASITDMLQKMMAQQQQSAEEMKQQQKHTEELILQQQQLSSERFDKLDERQEQLDGRQQDLEGSVQQLAQRLDGHQQDVEGSIQQLAQRLDAVQGEFYARVSETDVAAQPLFGAAPRSPATSPASVPSTGYARHDKRPVQRVQAYDGRVPWPAYKAQFEIAASLNGWSDSEKAQFLATSLTGPALSVLWNIPEVERGVYGRLASALDARFNDGRSGEMAKVKLMGRSRKRGESLAELASDIESLVHQAYPTCDASLWDTLARDYFLNGIEGEVK